MNTVFLGISGHDTLTNENVPDSGNLESQLLSYIEIILLEISIIRIYMYMYCKYKPQIIRFEFLKHY